MNDIIVAADHLKSIVQRVERLEGEIADLNADKSEIYKEARSNGFDVKAIKKVVSKRKLDESERQEQDHVFDMYWDAVHGSGLVHTHARENIEQFDRQTGEVHEINPRLAKKIVDGMQTEAGRAALVAAVDIMIEGVEAEEEEFQTKPEEEAEAKGAATVDAGSSIEEDLDRQPASEMGLADDGLQGVREQGANASVPAFEAPEGNNGLPLSDVDGSPGRPAANAGDCPDEEVKTEAANATRDADIVSTTASHQIHFEIVPPVPMKALPFAHCFPELSKAAYQALVEDIEANGVIEPIVRMGDTIVDGWNRYNAARHLQVKYPVTFYAGDDMLLDLIAWQRSSRDWTPAQEAKIAAALAKDIPHRADDIWAAFHIATGPDGEIVAA